MQLLFLYIKIIVIILLSSFTANARVATIEDANFSVEKKLDILVEANGSSSFSSELKYKILNESGRSHFADFRLYYNENTEKFNIIEASVITKGVTYNVNLKDIEDQPMASQQKGFDDTRQVLIAFPNVEIGSEIMIKFLKTSQEKLQNYFAFYEYLGSSELLNKYNLNIRSKLPIDLKINDKNGALEVKKSNDSEAWDFKINSTKPIYEVVLNENGLYNYANLTSISISSEKDFLQLAKKIAPKYHKAMEDELPKLLEEIVVYAKNTKNPVDQINIVTSMLNEKMQYMGNWVTFDKAFFPRSLDVIAKTQVGDCKDFTIAAGVILKALGYNVQPCLVWRSNTPNLNIELNLLPNLNLYNHVFLRVIDKEGRVYWIDPTNVVSMAQGLFPDIANKPILILDNDKPEYTKTPNLYYTAAKYIVSQVMVLDRNSFTANISGSFSLVGSEALFLAGAGLSNSEEAITDYLFQYISGKELKKEEKKELNIRADLTSRIVKDIIVDYKFNNTHAIKKTNLGSALFATRNSFANTFNDAAGQSLYLYLGRPYEYSEHIIIKNTKAKNLEKLNIEIDNKWIYGKISCMQEGQDIKINKTYFNKVDVISSQDLATKEYKDFKDLVLGLDNIMIVLD